MRLFAAEGFINGLWIGYTRFSFSARANGVDWGVQLSYAEEIGLGTRS